MEIASMIDAIGTHSLEQLHTSFLTNVLPMIQSHGRVYFRYLRCPHRKEDAIQEMVALCWKWHLRLAEKGKDSTEFPSALATYAAKAVRCGRKLAGMDRAKDVLSPRAQLANNFATCPLPEGSSMEGNLLDEALQDNLQTPVPDQVIFRQDFPRWMATLSERNRRVAEDLMVGERTLDVADRYGLSPGRISQLRDAFHRWWLTFCGELPDLSAPPVDGKCGQRQAVPC